MTNPDEWKTTIPQPWTKDKIATFQRLIDLRTLELYRTILTESGIENILPQ